MFRLPEELAARVHVLVREGQQSSKSKQPTIIDVKPQGNLPIQINTPPTFPSDPQNPSDDFIFVVDGREYPALVSIYTHKL